MRGDKKGAYMGAISKSYVLREIQATIESCSDMETISYFPVARGGPEIRQENDFSNGRRALYARTAIALNIPDHKWLIELQDMAIKTHFAESLDWEKRFYEAIPENGDLSKLSSRFYEWFDPDIHTIAEEADKLIELLKNCEVF